MIQTRYGDLEGVTAASFYENGIFKEGMFEKCCELTTEYGVLIPKYQITESRTKRRNAIGFYDSGIMKSIYLENQTLINTKINSFPVEMMTFYDDGSIHRLFPRYGQVSGFWSEEEEKKLAPNIKIVLPDITIDNKVSSICFYKNGSIKSVSLYPGETALFHKDGKVINLRFGISFYEDGSLKSLEPADQFPIDTRIGKIIAYDNNPLGIHGDENSLSFSKDGTVQKITTEATLVKLTGSENNVTVIEAVKKPSMLDIEVEIIVPLEIEFMDEELQVRDSDKILHSFLYEEYEIIAEYNLNYRIQDSCNNCDTCNKCH